MAGVWRISASPSKITDLWGLTGPSSDILGPFASRLLSIMGLPSQVHSHLYPARAHKVYSHMRDHTFGNVALLYAINMKTRSCMRPYFSDCCQSWYPSNSHATNFPQIIRLSLTKVVVSPFMVPTFWPPCPLGALTQVTPCAFCVILAVHRLGSKFIDYQLWYRTHTMQKPKRNHPTERP